MDSEIEFKIENLDNTCNVWKYAPNQAVYQRIVKKLLNFDLSQDLLDLPDFYDVFFLRPQEFHMHIRSKDEYMDNVIDESKELFDKIFTKNMLNLVFDFGNNWSFVWCSNDLSKSGWRKNGKLLEKN